MLLFIALFSIPESNSTLNKTKKYEQLCERPKVPISVQKFFISILLQSNNINCEIADSFELMGVKDFKCGTHLPFNPVSFFRNDNSSSFCSIFRPIMLRKALDIESSATFFFIFSPSLPRLPNETFYLFHRG